ncbi:hypothetical protein ACOME3_007211 [Neoechinorhynchus agilis]
MLHRLSGHLIKLVRFSSRRELSLEIDSSVLKRLQEINERSLRVELVGGGCSGLQVCFSLDSNLSGATDQTFELDSSGHRVIVDIESLKELNGARLEYQDDLIKRLATNKRQLIEVTEAASNELHRLLSQRNSSPSAGMRLSLKRHGCSGVSFELSYASGNTKRDELVEVANGIRLYIDPMAIMNVAGTRMDFVHDKLERKFTFSNPNASRTCGCGESFKFEK